jgi:hypothetical protein
MRFIAGILIATSAWAQSHSAVVPPATPKTAKSETLRYNVNWPSGLSLGEAQVTSNLHEGSWSFSFSMEAAVPGFALAETAKAQATADYCSIELEKNGNRGKRKLNETTTFDQKNLTATRKTGEGGKSELKIHSCAKDALTYIFFLRHELAAGRLPQTQNVYYGGGYSVRVQYAGAQTLRIGGEAVEADRLTLTMKGPASQMTSDMFFARDATRTPLLMQAPLAIGKFALELVR